jgi:signal transduction histidine kinase
VTSAVRPRAERSPFEAVLDRLPIGVVMFDAASKRVVYANNAARRAVRPEKLQSGKDLPEPWAEFSLPRYAERLVGLSIGADETIELGDGRAFIVSGMAPDADGVAVLTIEDISSRQRRLRAEREFVANAAHELLTPLTGIVGAAHVLQAGASEVPEDRDHFIDHIATECSRLTRIARSLLVLARAQSGEEPPRLEILPLHPLVEEVIEQINAKVTVEGDEDITVFADADLLVQALANLIANVVRHGASGEAVIEARTPSRNIVEIDIVDPEAVEPDLLAFRARFRSSAGRDGGGFGLGLSIAEQSLEVMGGRLLLNSSSARIQLPGGNI